MPEESEELRNRLVEELLSIVRSGLDTQELRQATDLLALLDDRLGPTESGVARAKSMVLAAIDSMERPDYRRAARALSLHPYEDDLLAAPELSGRLFRKKAIAFAGRICDHRALSEAEVRGYSKRWVEGTERQTIIPEIADNIIAGKFTPAGTNGERHTR